MNLALWAGLAQRWMHSLSIDVVWARFRAWLRSDVIWLSLLDLYSSVTLSFLSTPAFPSHPIVYLTSRYLWRSLRSLLDRQLSVNIILVEATKFGCIGGWLYRPWINGWALELSHVEALLRYNVIGWISSQILNKRQQSLLLAQILKQQKLLQYKNNAVFLSV